MLVVKIGKDEFTIEKGIVKGQNKAIKAMIEEVMSIQSPPEAGDPEGLLSDVLVDLFGARVILETNESVKGRKY
jgi:hypothetical protein